MTTENNSRSVSNRSAIEEILGRALARRREIEIDMQEINGIIANLENALNSSLRAIGAGDLPPVMPGEFKGMTLRQALTAYLQRRPGIKIAYERVAEDLWAGGAVWDDRKGGGAKGRLHNFKMSCTVNYDLVEQDKSAGLIWLNSTAGEKSKPKRKRS